MTPSAPRDEFFLDPKTVRRVFDRASSTYDTAAVVHSEVRLRLLERLDLVRMQPRIVVDLGAGTGQASRALKRRYRSARIIALDLSLGMLRESAPQQALLRRFSPVGGDAHRLPLKEGSVDLVFSNLLLQWCHDPDAVFGEVRRVLKPDGLLTFATLGPDTLRELRAAWALVDRHTHVHRFIDMHDLGDALLRAGFAEPVMDNERLTITYPGWSELRTELQLSGSTNAAFGRSRGLTGRAAGARARTALLAAQDNIQRDGRLSVSVEVVYGQAWAGTMRPPAKAEQEVRIPVGRIARRG